MQPRKEISFKKAMVYGKCSVFGCDTVGGKQHRFPRTPKVHVWKKFCQNPKMQGIPLEKLHDKFTICIKHFDVRCYTYPASGRLLRQAVPTLFPPTSSVQDLPTESVAEALEQWSSTSSSPETHHIFGGDSDSNQFSENLPELCIRKEVSCNNKDQYHMIEEMPEVYMNVTLPYLEKEPLYLKWVYDIIRGESEQERVVYESPCKDDKNGFVMIRDSEWDGEDLERLHLVALPYRPGLLTIRDLRDNHLPLLKNIYNIGKKVIEEKHVVPGSQLRIFIQYLPSFYHLNIHFTMVNDETCGTHVGKAHLLHSVINNLELCSNYYQLSNLQFYLVESHELFGKFKEHGLIGRHGRFNAR